MTALADERRAYAASQTDAELLATAQRDLSTGLRLAVAAELEARGLVLAG